MKLKTIIIDDEPIALEKLKGYVEKVPFLDLIAAFDSSVEAAAFLASNNADLIFTDINMPDLSGIEFVEAISKKNPLVVFITAHEQYALEGFRLSAVDYLLKPYGFSEFQRAANKALEQHTLRTNSTKTTKSSSRSKTAQPTVASDNSIFIKVDYRYIRIDLETIRFIKGFGEYLQIYVEGAQKPIITLSSFISLMEHLPEHFLQIHRSYAVNMNKVQQIERNRMVMDAENYLPIGDIYKPKVNSWLQKHSIGPR